MGSCVQKRIFFAEQTALTEPIGEIGVDFCNYNKLSVIKYLKLDS